MTPQEKAKELVDKFKSIDIECRDSIEGTYFMCMRNLDAKQCALMAVNELYRIAPWSLENDIQDDSKQYWNLVKIEIEKL